jgi:hypothetical protein
VTAFGNLPAEISPRIKFPDVLRLIKVRFIELLFVEIVEPHQVRIGLSSTILSSAFANKKFPTKPVAVLIDRVGPVAPVGPVGPVGPLPGAAQDVTPVPFVDKTYPEVPAFGGSLSEYVLVLFPGYTLTPPDEFENTIGFPLIVNPPPEAVQNRSLWSTLCTAPHALRLTRASGAPVTTMGTKGICNM